VTAEHKFSTTGQKSISPSSSLLSLCVEYTQVRTFTQRGAEGPNKWSKRITLKDYATLWLIWGAH